MSDLVIAIRRDDLSDGNIVRLLGEHRLEMLKHSPPESVHALDVHQLKAPNISFWSAWVERDGESSFAGCGALKQLSPDHVELKSMKTDKAHLRKGVAQAVLNHLIDNARDQGMQRISLETGTQDVFIPARTLYTRAGFKECPPFADYKVDPVSVCMSMEIG